MVSFFVVVATNKLRNIGCKTSNITHQKIEHHKLEWKAEAKTDTRNKTYTPPSKDVKKVKDVHTTVKRCQEGEKKIWQTILAHEQIFDHFVTILPQTPNDQAGIIDAKISASEHHHIAF